MKVLGDVTFTVPGPPVPCARARVERTARGFHTARTPDATKRYQKHVAYCGLAAIQQMVGWPMAAPSYGLKVVVHRATLRGDADNYLKTYADALRKIAYKDDAQVLFMQVRIEPGRSESPRAEITVEAYAAPSA